MHPEVQAIVDELDNHRIRFMALCRTFTDEELGRPVPGSEWVVRDFIAHLATIDEPVMEMFRALHKGREADAAGPDARWDVDQWNQRQVMERRDVPFWDLLQEAARLRTELRGVLASLTEEDLSRTIHFRGDARRPAADIELRRYLRGWCKHDAMHAVDIMRAVPEKMSRILEQWFDDPVVEQYQAAMNR